MSAHQDAIGRPSRSQQTKDLVFRLALWACLVLAIGLLVVLLVDVALDGTGAFNWDFINNFTSISADKAGIQAALWGTIWLMGVCAFFIVPVGIATAIYLEEYGDPTKWWNRLIELNIQNLAAVPSIVYGILGLAFLVRGPLQPRERRAGRWPDARAARAADGDHRRPGGAARRAVLDPRGLHGARRHPVADHLAPGAAGGGAGHRHRCDPCAVPRDR